MDTPSQEITSDEVKPPEWYADMIGQYKTAHANGLENLCQQLRVEWKKYHGEDCLHQTATGEIDF